MPMLEGSCLDGSVAGKWQHPPSFYCPISQQCMHDPVVLCDGHTYERRHIDRWLRQHDTSPVSGLKLPQKDIFPNHALRNAIEEYFQQVFSAHRRAIRKTLSRPNAGERPVTEACLARRVDALMQCSLLMNADLSTECVLRQIMDEAKTLLGAEAASVFLYDAASQELFSTVNSTGGELRIPATSGVAGHVARFGEPLVIEDAYNDDRFDCTVDVRTGFRTRSMVCVPLKAKKGRTLGVAQLINKTAAEAPAGEDGAAPGFSPEDLHLLQVFASQAVSAVAHDSTPELPEAVPAACCRPPALERGLTDELAQASCGARLSRDLVREIEGGRDDAELPGTAPPSPDHAEKAGAVPEAGGEDAGGAVGTQEERDDSAARALLEQAFSSWEFDALALARVTANRPLSSLAVFLFDRCGLIEELGLDEEKVAHFFTEIEKGYDDGTSVYYHNRAHGASVLHAMHALLHHGGVLAAAAPALAGGAAGGGGGAAAAAGAETGGQLERMACLIAAAIHDYDHKGLSNDFLAKTGHERAVLYNDLHVNEQHHSAAAFALLLRPENNFLEHLPASDLRRLRTLAVQLVLGTDMAEGGRILKSFNALLEARPESSAEPFVPGKAEEALLMLQMAMKCADLGHLALSWDGHCQWVRCLETEFFAQGDLEREAGLPISFLMDRNKPGASATQVGFFGAVALPLFRSLVRAAPAAAPLGERAAANARRWEELEAPQEEAAAPQGSGDDPRDSAAAGEAGQNRAVIVAKTSGGQNRSAACCGAGGA